MITQTHKIDSRGLETGWEQVGSDNAPIVCFLHGFPDSPAIWDLQIGHLKERFQVLAPYARGSGPSEAAPEISRYGIESASLDILRILDSVDPDQNRNVILVGHDLGAFTAWNLGALLGNRLKGLVIFNGLSIEQAGGRVFSAKQWFQSWYILFMQVPKLPEWLTRHLPETFNAYAYWRGALPKDKRPTELPANIPQTLNQYRAIVRKFPELITRPFTPLKCPVLVIWGSADPFVSHPSVDELAPFAQNLTIRVLKGGHWIFREQSERVNSLLDSFLHQTGEIK